MSTRFCSIFLRKNISLNLLSFSTSCHIFSWCIHKPQEITMKPLFFTAFFGIVIGLSGCATSYKAQGMKGGFSDTPLAKNTYAVNFQGNGYTSASKTRDFALLRAAEIMQNNNYPYFIVLQGDTSTIAKNVEWSQTQQNTLINSYSGVTRINTSTSAPVTSVVSKHDTQVVVKGFNLPNVPQNALSTQQIISSIKAKYKIDD